MSKIFLLIMNMGNDHSQKASGGKAIACRMVPQGIIKLHGIKRQTRETLQVHAFRFYN
jgi:hypothetical protein